MTVMNKSDKTQESLVCQTLSMESEIQRDFHIEIHR